MRIRDEVTRLVRRESLGSLVRIDPVGGGCIANASQIETTEGVFFLKYGSGGVAKSLEAEAVGLRALQSAGSSLKIPSVVACSLDRTSDFGMLLLEWIESGPRDNAFWEGFGQSLASLHKYSRSTYGFGQDNFIGRLPQENTWDDHWPTFFHNQRLRPQVAKASARGLWEKKWNRPLQEIYARLDEIMPRYPNASLVHGDLWSGNFMAMATGQAVLIDPAPYFGHAETDIAMTELFGGYCPHFYDAYYEVVPREENDVIRKEVYNLYHLINHLNHFGPSYAAAISKTLSRFA